MTSIHQELRASWAVGPRAWSYRARIGWTLAILSFPLAAYLVERCVVPRSIQAALPALQALDARLQAGSQENEPDSQAAASDSALAAPFDEKRQPGARPKGSILRSVQVAKEQVLQWVKARTIPRGRSVRKTWYLSEGIEIQGAAAFGIGLTSRDRLVRVDGQPVAAPSEAIEAVLSAVGRQSSTVQGVFMRETETAVVTTQVQVALPDLEALGEE